MRWGSVGNGLKLRVERFRLDIRFVCFLTERSGIGMLPRKVVESLELFKRHLDEALGLPGSGVIMAVLGSRLE